MAPLGGGGSTAARVSGAIGEGVGFGSIAGAGHSEAGGPPPVRRGHVEGGTGGGLTAGVLSGGGALLGRLARGSGRAADRVQDIADRQRLSALGARKRDIADVGERFPGGVGAAADSARRQGLTGTLRTPGSFADDVEAARRPRGSVWATCSTKPRPGHGWSAERVVLSNVSDVVDDMGRPSPAPAGPRRGTVDELTVRSESPRTDWELAGPDTNYRTPAITGARVRRG